LAVLVSALLVGAAALVTVLDSSSKRTKDIEVVKVWSDDVDAPAGMVYYLLDINATNIGTAVWHVDPSFFTLTSNASIGYQWVPNYNETPLLTGSDLGTGGHVDGEVVFELPQNQSPSALSYSDPAGIKLELNSIPAVTAVASRFDPVLHYTFNGSDSWGVALDTWGQIDNFTTPGYVFFTGQKILASFSFTYLKRPSDPNTIVIESVTNNNGFPETQARAQPTALGSVATGTDYPLPVSMVEHGASVAVILILTVPPGPQHGPLGFTIQWGT
jgi:hypothetical protein